MTFTMTLLLLSLTAGFVTPTLANYFFNPYTNIGRNVGSAPSPTPQDVRENRLPRLVHANPPYADVMPTERPRKEERAQDGQTSAEAESGKKLSSATPSRR